MPADKKVIVVSCGSKRQSMGLVQAILSEGDKSEFSIRAITRDLTSEQAVWMKEKGVDVRDVSLDDEAAVTRALEGAYGFFAVTPFWEYPDVVLHQARAMATAAKAAGIKHVVWSTLEDTRDFMKSECPTLMDHFKVPHFDVRGEADKYFKEAGVPTTYVLTSCYWDAFIETLAPKKTTDGKLALQLPLGSKRMAGIASEDIGKCVNAIFKRPSEYVNKRVGVVGEVLTLTQVADKISKATGKKVEYKEISTEEYRNLNEPRSKEIANMFQFYAEHEDVILKNRSLEESKKLNAELLNFDLWLEKFKELIPIASV